MSGDLSMPAANEPQISGSGAQRLTDARMAVLVTEYLELAEQELHRSSLAEHAAERKPPRSYSLAHYDSRGAEDLRARRSELLSTLQSEGMPTGHWVGYGDRAVLLKERPPGYPEGVELYDALWQILEESSEDTPPIEIARASRRVEFRRSLSAPRRFLLDLYSGDIAVPGRSEFSALPIAALVLVIFAVSVLLSAGASTGTIISAGIVTAFASLLVIGELTAAAGSQVARVVADLRAREAGRLPEPEELVFVGGREARVQYPEPGEKSPVHDGMFDVRFDSDGASARVKAEDLRPLVLPPADNHQRRHLQNRTRRGSPNSHATEAPGNAGGKR